jgi:intracellular sulfur oxidation DsrE/DsrF family protein
MLADSNSRRESPVKILASAFVALLACGCVSVTSTEAPRHPPAAASPSEMRVAFDITDGNPKALMVKLATIDLTRKQLIDRGITPKMVIAFRGDASYYTQTDMSLVKEADREDAAKIQAKIRELRAANGVDSVEQCTVPLASRKINPSNLMPEVKLVQNGWIALAEYQEKGYSYIVP